MLNLRHDLWCGYIPFYIQNNKTLLAFQKKLMLPPFLLLQHPLTLFWEIHLSLPPFTHYKDPHHNPMHPNLGHPIYCSASPSERSSMLLFQGILSIFTHVQWACHVTTWQWLTSQAVFHFITQVTQLCDNSPNFDIFKKLNPIILACWTMLLPFTSHPEFRSLFSTVSHLVTASLG